MLRILWAAGFVLAFAVPLALAHDDAQWIADQRLKNEMGELCCGVTDCKRLAPGDVSITSGGYRINSERETIPYSKALPASPEGYWQCKWGGERKCFIVPPSGS